MVEVWPKQVSDQDRYGGSERNQSTQAVFRLVRLELAVFGGWAAHVAPTPQPAVASLEEEGVDGQDRGRESAWHGPKGHCLKRELTSLNCGRRGQCIESGSAGRRRAGLSRSRSHTSR
jgi:hypothetical protein